MSVLEELFEVCQSTGFGICEDEKRVNLRVLVLGLLPGHVEVFDQVAVLVDSLGCGRNLCYKVWILSSDQGLNGFVYFILLQQVLSKKAPCCGEVSLGGICTCPGHILEILQQNLDGLLLQVVLVVDCEGDFMQLGTCGDVGNVLGVVVCEVVDVLHDFVLPGSDGTHDEEIFEESVLAELSMDNNLV